VFEDWGFARSGHAAGTIAVLQGAPGTGKTLVAGVIARELGAELYRVEAARIAARPEDIEPGLAAVLDAADDGTAIVVFEDAEAVLPWLDLRRLDAFEGIALFALDDGSELARPITRRLASRIALSPPDAELREQLWQLHLPSALPRDADVDLRALARHAMSGGSIRSAAVRAAVLAAEAGTGVTQAHLESAVRLELLERDPAPRPDA
jgi:SpoVK/Ycf46/Vps4 family AAA+-type ATPase